VVLTLDLDASERAPEQRHHARAQRLPPRLLVDEPDHEHLTRLRVLEYDGREPVHLREVEVHRLVEHLSHLSQALAASACSPSRLAASPGSSAAAIALPTTAYLRQPSA